ncbi:hypothetical protein JHK82_034079 [Glycine max]|nr:hypothetical protein JHK85_034787 [Glycine max]KAG4986458.1 hypothetical protein JHK86_034149 [Glycine max]KAG5119659.1 hypothetical protein JHK82_034079 [Glycine max]KAG5140645.1 hypothetical protein JHK84_034413 [Glycine max]
MFVLTARPLALFASAHSVFLNEVIFIALKLVRYTDLTKDQVRNSLLVLVQHNCAQALVSAPQDDDDDADRLRVRTQYLVLFDNIIHRLRFPKFLEIVLRKLDEEFVKLLVGLLQDGRLTLKQMVDRESQGKGKCFMMHVIVVSTSFKETTSRKLGAKSVKVNSARIADSIHYGTRIATIKKSLIDPMGNLRNWNSGDLCMANWTGVWRSDREEADGYFHKEKNSIRGDGTGRASLHAPQRRPKYKSGPLGPPGVAYHSMYSLAAPVFEVENGGSFMAGSPFSGDGLTICSGGHGGALSARTKPCMAFLASVHGCSKIQNDKFGGFKDVGTNVSCVVSRRDMATQMSPQGPYSLAEAQNKSKAGKKKK